MTDEQVGQRTGEMVGEKKSLGAAAGDVGYLPLRRLENSPMV